MKKYKTPNHCVDSDRENVGIYAVIIKPSIGVSLVCFPVWSRMYAAGDGVPQNFSAAMEWLKKSAEQEHPRAQYELGQIYELGMWNVPKNDSAAFKWYTKSLKSFQLV